jgi:hypothetical protein
MSTFATWDAVNRRLRRPARCPWPDCGQPVPEREVRPTLDWCGTCDRPFERVVLPGRHLALRRAEVARCTETGVVIDAASPLDWSGGGDASRAGCQDDPEDLVFGRVVPRSELWLKERWKRPALGGEHEGDLVCGVAVVRGAVAVLTRGGRLGLLSMADGFPLDASPHALEWPDGSIVLGDPDRTVAFPPAVRGTWIAACTARELVLRDLTPHLFGVGAMPTPRVVRAAPGKKLHGPPTWVDTPSGPAVLVVEGAAEAGRGWLEAPTLRFEGPRGEVARVPAPGLARPPVVDHEGRLWWVDRYGSLSVLPLSELTTDATPRYVPPVELLDVAVVPRLLFAASRDPGGHAELWLALATPGSAVTVARTSVERVLGGGAWSWDVRRYGGQGRLQGLAVGRGSTFGASTTDLLSVTTEEGAWTMSKSTPDVFHAIGLPGAAEGSSDAPVLCGAGVVVRTQHRLWLDATTTRRSEFAPRPSVQLDAASFHGSGQGLALYGRSILLGHLDEVRCVDICSRAP